ncbi:MAG: PilZ domain-containing protein [Chloroflexi bacterium]|nr:PilZ domain-containing protein [Chloroflexota bacterium]
MEERRKLPRKYLMAYSCVFNHHDGQLLGYLCDLTIDGLMVISKEAVQPETQLELRIDLPEVPLFPKRRLLLQARAIWCRPDVDPRLYNIGFQFLEVPPDDGSIIEQMIDAYEFRRDDDVYPPSVSRINNKA